MKKLLIAVAVLVIVVAAGLLFTLSNLGPIVKKAVNTVGPKVLKTEVSVADVSVSIFSGQTKIKQFFLGNPQGLGFKTAQAMTVGSIFVDIDEKSITSNPIVINKIEILAPRITYEKLKGTDNFQALLRNIQSSAKAESKPAQAGDDTAKGEARKVVINHVIVKDGSVNLAMALLGGKEITAPLPDIHLTDIGKEKGGASPAEAAQQLFDSLYQSLSSDSVNQVFKDGLQQLGKLKDLGAAGLSGGTDAAQKAADSASKGVESITKGVQGLFKK